MNTRTAVCAGVLLLAALAATALNPHAAESSAANHATQETQLPPIPAPAGKQLYKAYCAACHGPDGKGHGPVAPSLRRQPPNLTTLAKRHGGEFPEEYVTIVLSFGPGFSAHGSSEMPVWGPIFQDLENHNDAVVRQRIKSLCEFLESIQEK